MTWLRFLAKSVVHGAIDLSGKPRRIRGRRRDRLHILTYHSFSKDWTSGFSNSLSVRRFEKQIQFLRRYFSVVSLEDGLQRLQRGKIEDRPLVAITIDDGFEDNYSYAWPVLRNHCVPATIFLATDFIDTGRLPWPNRLNELLYRTRKQVMKAPFFADLGCVAARRVAVRRLKHELSFLAPEERFAMLETLRKHLEIEGRVTRKPLTWDQIRSMKTEGIRFGSHTKYHSMLPMMPEAVVRDELLESKRRIEHELGGLCRTFAYPDGKHNDETKSALRDAGYTVAVTQDLGANNADAEWLCLKRIEVPFDDPLPSFRCRVSLALMADLSVG